MPSGFFRHLKIRILRVQFQKNGCVARRAAATKPRPARLVERGGAHGQEAQQVDRAARSVAWGSSGLQGGGVKGQPAWRWAATQQEGQEERGNSHQSDREQD